MEDLGSIFQLQGVCDSVLPVGLPWGNYTLVLIRQNMDSLSSYTTIA